MKSTLPTVAGLLGLMAALYVSQAMGQVINFRSSENSDSMAVAMASDKGPSPFVPEDSTAPAAPAANAGAACNCDSGCCLGKLCGCGCGCGCGKADCDECPGIGIELFSGVESWHNLTNDVFHDTTGPVAGANIGVPIPTLREYGIGAQFGARYTRRRSRRPIGHQWQRLCLQQRRNRTASIPYSRPVPPCVRRRALQTRDSAWASPMTGW